ncbi:MAG: adenylate/guanylate cyclase domain-containing protein [Pseudomonadota bacterium]
MTRWPLLLGPALTALCIVLTIWPGAALERVREVVFDSYQRAYPRNYDPQSPVHVVDIDEAALAALGQWPWPRTYLAELTDRLFAHGAVAIGYDVLFAEPDRTSPEVLSRSLHRFSSGDGAGIPQGPSHDIQFAEAIGRGPVVLAMSGRDGTGSMPVVKAGISVAGELPDGGLQHFGSAVMPLPVLADAAAGIGTITPTQGPDGIVRGVPLVSRIGETLVPALSTELLRVAQGAGSHLLRTSSASGDVAGGRSVPTALRVGAVTVPLEADGSLRVHFSGAREGRVTSARDVLDPAGEGAPLANRIGGKLVLIGASAQGLSDIRKSPLEGQIPGVLVHAEALEQMIAGTFLTRPDWALGLEVLLVVVFGGAITLAQMRDAPLAGLWAGMALAGGTIGGAFLAFRGAGLLFNPVMPVVAIMLVYVPNTTIGYLSKERARRAINARFAYFLPKPVMDDILRDPREGLTPDGAEREVSVMFVDMRGFTSITERLSPEEVVHLVNRYLSAVTGALLRTGATIDKFMGDAVMAFWNAPLKQEDHRARALTALGDIDAAIEKLNAELVRDGLPALGIGVGLNTGSSYVGLMGSADRLSYTCMGDSVTLAARLEGLTRIYGVPNCVGEDMIGALPPGLVAIELDRVSVKGRERPVTVYTVLDEGTEGVSALREHLATARGHLRDRDWNAAEHAFAALSECACSGCDPAHLAREFASRIASYRTAPPAPDWDGTHIARSKR